MIAELSEPAQTDVAAVVSKPQILENSGRNRLTLRRSHLLAAKVRQLSTISKKIQEKVQKMVEICIMRQNNRPTRDYVDEISQYFDDVKVKNNVIIAKNPKETTKQSIWDFDGEYKGNDVRFGEQGRSLVELCDSELKRLRKDAENIINKPERIEKLRNSEPVEITDADYKEKYFNRQTAKQWMRENLRGEYVNDDTNDRIRISNVGINEVTSHGTTDEAHMKSLVAIPQMIKNSVYIEEYKNNKDNGKADSYRYYVCPLKIDGEDYTAKLVVGVKNGNSYYDHHLTQIEKGKLIDNLNRLSNSVVGNEESLKFVGKDTKLFSILQTNPYEIAAAKQKMRDIDAEMQSRGSKQLTESGMQVDEGRR